MAEKVVKWNEESLQAMWVRVRLGKECWAFISVYGPGSKNSVEVVKVFWSNLTSCIENLKVKNKVVLLGDMNVRVEEEELEGICGRYGVAGRNKGDDKLMDISDEQELVVGSMRM